jgi:VanZ family protein
LTKIRVLANAAFVIGVVLLIILSLAPAQDLPKSQLNDKWSHIIAYAILMAAFGVGSLKWRRCIVGALVVFALGVALEGLQSLVPGREASLLDVAANSIGVFVGICVAVGTVRAIEACADSHC